MAQNRTAVDKREINKKAKAKRVDKRNITFSLPSDLLERFSKAVGKEDLTMTDVLEQMLKSYLGEK